MKYYLIAGEASGDLHGANLMRALAEIWPLWAFGKWLRTCAPFFAI